MIYTDLKVTNFKDKLDKQHKKHLVSSYVIMNENCSFESNI